MAIVGRNQTDAVFIRQFDKTFIGNTFFRQAMILNFQEVIVLAEDVNILLHQTVSFIFVVLNQCPRHITGNTSRQTDNPLMVLPQKLLVHTRLVIHAFNIGQRHQLYQILIAGLIFSQQNQMVILGSIDFLTFLAGAGSKINLAANNGLNALLLAFFIKINRAIHDAMVGNGQMFHAQFFGAGHQLLDAGGTIQQTELRMNMEVGKFDIACCFHK